MIEYYREIRRALANFLESFGLDPLYTSTVFVLIVVAYHWKNYRHLDKLEKHEKGVLEALLFGAIILVSVSILRLIGAI